MQPIIRGTYKKKPIIPPDPIKISQQAQQIASKTAEEFKLHKEEITAKIDKVVAKTEETTTLVKETIVGANKALENGQKRIDEAILAIPEPKDGQDGETPIIDYGAIIDEVLSKIPNPEGIDIEKLKSDILDEAKKQIPGPQKIDEVRLIKKIISKIPKVAGSLKIITEKIDPKEIINKVLEDERILKFDGLEDKIKKFWDKYPRGYLHGGGDTVKAGTNITITTNSDGTKTITSTGGGSQTPWTSDIDAASFDLNNLKKLNFISGTLLVTPVAGTVEFDGTDLYFSV